ncbi:hatching enzyme 1.2 [Bacillus rossius redtenbacheri]|uniref:hatching enzyme 1.2 n=1 Tax=Bacillus rossius redtenbacheri TaxID=93214 RepID=UPI002FDCCA0C
MAAAGVLCVVAGALLGLCAARRHGPLHPAHPGVTRSSDDEVERLVSQWSPADPVSAWELSGLFEGDIMLDGDGDPRNALQDEAVHWLNGVVPYVIDKEHFTKDQLDVIHEAMKEFHQKTCLRFRPHKKADEDYVMFRGNRSGCWSYVGKRGGGQVINLQTKGCVHHGIVVHEMLHALGFYHQQSAPERDDFVTINWQNIKTGKEHNFQKHNASRVTNYGILYDYGSVMHYSAHAFSKNGEPTITPLDKEAEIGQRDGLSEKDVAKLHYMYNCMDDDSEEMYWELPEDRLPPSSI